MRGITSDYFDSFTAIFGPKECLLNGKRYPLGHFATEAPEMDRRLLRDLEKAIADFKPELEVFLAARTASSAAVAQQKLDAVWATLVQLLPSDILRRLMSRRSGGQQCVLNADRSDPANRRVRSVSRSFNPNRFFFPRVSAH